MEVPEGAPVDVYETILVYEKDGNRQEFTDKNFPWQDTTWKWVETRQKLLKKGYTPPIHDFSITSPDGVDLTDSLLAEKGYVFLIISPNLSQASRTGFEALTPMALRARELGFAVYGLTSSAGDLVEAFTREVSPPYAFCTADETTLKTIIRANPGVLLLHEGTVIGKWNYRDAPRATQLKANLLSEVMLKQEKRGNTLVTVMLAFAYALCYGLFFRLLSLFCKKRG
jgi:triosephosphate isomerase